MKVLAIGAHPDDLEYFCGGTLVRYAQMGARVVMCVVTDGRTNPIGDPVHIAALRRGEAQASANLIGAELHWLGIHDGELILDVATKRLMVDVMGLSEPDIIITHPPEDYHADHVTTSNLVVGAAQQTWVKYVSLRRSVPVAFMATERGINFSPEDHVDISPVWETKVNMLLQHRTQYLPGPDYSPGQVQEPLEQYNLIQSARVMGEFFGLSCGVKFAEPFRWWRAAYRIVPRRLLP